MTKSVVIIGKGPSVLKSTKELVDSFDEVAICNFPPMEGYEQYIGNRATYHFLNVHDPNPYKRERLDSLGLKYMFNTHPVPHPGYKEIFPNQDVEYFEDYGKKKFKEFEIKFGFDSGHGGGPSCGIMAFEYFVKKEEFDTISLVGFDFFKVGERGYYYELQEVQASHRYLYSSKGDKPFNEEGIRVKENPHGSKRSEKFIYDMIEYYGKKLRHIQ